MLGSVSSQAVHPAAQIHGIHPQQQTSVAMGRFARHVFFLRSIFYKTQPI